VSVTVNATGALKMLDRLEEVAGGKREVMRKGAAMMRRATQRAVGTNSDPATGRPWPSRKHSYSWPMMLHTGRLRSALDAGYGIRMRRGGPRLFGTVADTTYPDGTPVVLVAGAVHFGRSRGRTSRGTRLFGRGPTSGAVPPRPLFGMSSADRGEFARAWRRAIRKAAD